MMGYIEGLLGTFFKSFFMYLNKNLNFKQTTLDTLKLASKK